jgi:hypothetical protein
MYNAFFEQSLINSKKVFHWADNVLAAARLDKFEEVFIAHNKKTWGRFTPEKGQGEILLEFNSMSSSIIAFSYLANVLSKLHGAAIKAYVIGRNVIKEKILQRKFRKIFKSFNVEAFLSYQLSPAQLAEVDNLYDGILFDIKTKKDVEDLRLEDLWIGDLLYDSHCLQYMTPTVEINDWRFYNSLKEAVGSYVYWRDYFKTHQVKAVIVTHTVYTQSGIISRLAIKQGIPIYQVNATHLYFMSEKNLGAYNDFFYYPEKFRKLSIAEQKEGMALAKEKIKQRFSGKVGVDMHYSTKSAYGGLRKNRIIRESERIKILVATHCFFDSPHPYGINLFPDFYEWLYFLGAISEKTDYDWYIKTHPDFLPGNIPIIKEFIDKYPKFTLIPSDTSHLQLIEEGINYGLTVYGTIGFEYAALGVPVITASLCNPHIRYRFNTHPRTISEYENILMNLHLHKLEIDINEVYEYYYMAFIDHTNNWLFGDYEGFLKEIGGYAKQVESISYDVFLRDFSQERHRQITESLIEFIDSGEYRFRNHNYAQ